MTLRGKIVQEMIINVDFLIIIVILYVNYIYFYFLHDFSKYSHIFFLHIYYNF